MSNLLDVFQSSTRNFLLIFVSLIIIHHICHSHRFQHYQYFNDLSLTGNVLAMVKLVFL